MFLCAVKKICCIVHLILPADACGNELIILLFTCQIIPACQHISPPITLAGDNWIYCSVQIILLESSSRLGGWVSTLRHEDGSLFERGPRSIRGVGRPGYNTLEMVSSSINYARLLLGSWNWNLSLMKIIKMQIYFSSHEGYIDEFIRFFAHPKPKLYWDLLNLYCDQALHSRFKKKKNVLDTCIYIQKSFIMMLLGFSVNQKTCLK